MNGKVWLVGAGPSDVRLLTVRAVEVLKRAEAVVYDRLIGESILNLIPIEAQKIDAGKRAGNHTMPQEEINQLLLKLAQEGKRVVRLKGGDPFLFGRGAEELELLVSHGIDFEIVPGITSALSVPAYHGIPVTHRDCASSLHIITGHKKRDMPLELDFEALVRMGGTLVFLMGIAALSDICEGLLEAGMDKSMPAAVLQQGTTAGQKKISAAIAALPEEVKGQSIETPAILVVGKVCEYGDLFGWYEKQPLFGQKILVTRPRERSGTISDKLRELGAEVLELPTIRTVPIPKNERLKQELSRLEQYQYLVFTSPAGVQIFFDGLRQQGMDIRDIGAARLAAIGQGTQKELEDRGLVCGLMPEIYDAAHLGILLGETCKSQEHILIARAAKGSPQLILEIEKRTTASITDLAIYETVYELPSEFVSLPEQIKQDRITMAVFTSASTVRGFAAVMQGADYIRFPAVCIGTQTEQAARSLGMKTRTSKEATIDSLVECCVTLAAGES